MIQPVAHVIYCRGCQRAWIDLELDFGTVSVSGVIDARDCECTCADDSHPLYEAWVVDPDPASIPAGAWPPRAHPGTPPHRVRH